VRLYNAKTVSRGHIDLSVTDEIKSRIDLVGYIQQYVQLDRAGRYYKACCPFHHEKTPSFVVNADTQTWRCFGACTEGGDLFSFAMKYHGLSFKEALEQLGQQAGVEVRKQTPQQRTRDEHAEKLRGLLKTAADIYHEHLLSDSSDAVRTTLRYTTEKRGFTLETIKNFGIGYAPPGWQNLLDELQHLGYDADLLIQAGTIIRNDEGRLYDRFRNRLMVPICDERGRVVGFGARALDPNDNPKYLNSPQTPVFDKSRILFGLDKARRSIRDSETAVIVEGYMDVIQAHQAGFTNVVAQMGTALTDTQLALIAPRYAKKIVLALDADDAGQNATRRSLEMARQTLTADYSGKLNVDIRVLQIPDAKDPDDLIRENSEAWQSLVEAAVPVADFVIDMETADLPDDAGLQARLAAARRIVPILTATESNLYKRENLQKLALRLRMPERELLDIAEEQVRIERQRSEDRERNRERVSKQPSPLPRLNDEWGQEVSGRSSGQSDMPPPPDLETLDAYYHTGEADSAGFLLGEEAPGTDSALEAYCLRMMVLHPNVFYAVNRKFRELAGEHLALREGPLQDLGVADFTTDAYQSLVHTFLNAANQDDMEVLDYVRKHSEVRLRNTLERVLVEEAESLRHQIQLRFSVDLVDLMKDYDRRIRPSLDVIEEFISKAIELRKARIKRELFELGFMQKDLRQKSPTTDDHLAGDVNLKIHLSSLAHQLLDSARQQQNNII
jgi:DNA primase